MPINCSKCLEGWCFKCFDRAGPYDDYVSFTGLCPIPTHGEGEAHSLVSVCVRWLRWEGWPSCVQWGVVAETEKHKQLRIGSFTHPHNGGRKEFYIHTNRL